MSGTGPTLKKEEIENLSKYILDRAKISRSREIVIMHEDLEPYLFDDQYKSETDPQKQEQFLRRLKNRIRFKAANKLKDHGIKCKFENYDTGYRFTIDNNVDIDMKTDEHVALVEQNQQVSTFFDYDTKFIPPRQFPLIVESLRHGFRPLLVGPKGTGKSRALQEAFALLGIPHRSIALGMISEPADLVGSINIVEENGVPITKHIPGLITDAATKGEAVILDEFDSINGAVAPSLNSVLESGSFIVQTENGPLKIQCHKNYRIAATANTWGYGDDSGFYMRDIQDRSTWDRMMPKIDMDYDPELEMSVLEHFVNSEIISVFYDKTMGLVTKIREEIKTKKIHDECSLRSIIAFGKHFKIFGWHKAMHLFINEFKPEYRNQITEMLTMSWGAEFKPSMNDYQKETMGIEDETFIPNLEAKMKQNGKNAFLRR